MLKYFLLSLTFLTRIPVPNNLLDYNATRFKKRRDEITSDYKNITSKDLAASTLFLPVIGALLGLFYWAIIFVFGEIVPRDYLALVLLILGIFITGALHEDGVADVFDAFGSQNKKEDILRVLKDSRLGTYGVLSLVLLILIKFLLLRDIPLEVLGAVILTAQVLPRWVVSPIMYLTPYGRKESEKSKSIVDGIKELNPNDLIISGLFAIAVPIFLLQIQGFLFIFITIIVAAVASDYFGKKLQGITGDCLGAIEQFCEVAIYILALILYV